MKTKRLLLTGVSGFVGSHMLRHVLENTDWNVTGIASWKHKGTPERVQVALGDRQEWKDRVQIVTHELSAPFTNRTRRALFENQFDFIVNAAAESHVNRSIEDPRLFVDNNVQIALNMLELAREASPRVFLQVSTDEVYGAAPQGHAHAEWESIVPSNPYSASKACQEAIAISYWRTYGVPLVLTNTMNNFGETQDSEKFVAQVIRSIAHDKPITVHGHELNDGGGSWAFGSRFYLHARNHADAILFLLREHRPSQYRDADYAILPSRFNVVGDVELDNMQVVETIAKIMDKRPVIIRQDYHATRPGHDRRYALDGTKLKSLGWRAPIGFQMSLERYVHWTLKHKEWL